MNIRRRYEAEVLRQVADHGGFSAFWVMDNRLRASAADRLIRRGRIVRKRGRGFGLYPWAGYRLQKI